MGFFKIKDEYCCEVLINSSDTDFGNVRSTVSSISLKAGPISEKKLIRGSVFTDSFNKN
jgi:hypothetical protein